MLVWARESARMTVAEAAQRLAVSETVLTGWESGDQHPTARQLRMAAAKYRRPLAAFFLATPPEKRDQIRTVDFRRAADGALRGASSELEFALRRLEGRREDAEELAQAVGYEFQSIPTGLVDSADPEGTAARIRAWLGVSTENQQRGATTLRYWSDVVEAAGVLVTQAQRIAAECRGFSLSAGSLPPGIALSSADSETGRVFTLVHELVHVLRGDTAVICDPDGNAEAQEEIERLCNSVAASTLMPRRDLERHAFKEGDLDPESVDRWASKFGVSGEAFLRRLVDLNQISWSFYLSERSRLSTRWEGVRALRRRRQGGPPPDRVAIAKNGRLLTSLTLDAYAQGALTTTKTLGLLEVKDRWLPRVQAAVIATDR